MSIAGAVVFFALALVSGWQGYQLCRFRAYRPACVSFVIASMLVGYGGSLLWR